MFKKIMATTMAVMTLVGSGLKGYKKPEVYVVYNVTGIDEVLEESDADEFTGVLTIYISCANVHDDKTFECQYRTTFDDVTREAAREQADDGFDIDDEDIDHIGEQVNEFTGEHWDAIFVDYVLTLE